MTFENVKFGILQ